MVRIRLLTAQQKLDRKARKSVRQAYWDAAREKQIALLNSVKSNIKHAH